MFSMIVWFVDLILTMVILSISSYLRLLIDYQPEILGVFNILSRINTNCTLHIISVQLVFIRDRILNTPNISGW